MKCDQICHRAETVPGYNVTSGLAVRKTRLGSQRASASQVLRPMSTYRLKNLLSPRSVALVGASPRQGSVGRAILNNIRKSQFKGDFGLVNPRYSDIDGIAAVGSLAKLPFAPELVVITAPAKSIPGLIDE